METVMDKAVIAKFTPFLVAQRGVRDSSLQKVIGAPIYVWYGQRGTSWVPIGEPIVTTEPLATKVSDLAAELRLLGVGSDAHRIFVRVAERLEAL